MKLNNSQKTRTTMKIVATFTFVFCTLILCTGLISAEHIELKDIMGYRGGKANLTWNGAGTKTIYLSIPSEMDISTINMSLQGYTVNQASTFTINDGWNVTTYSGLYLTGAGGIYNPSYTDDGYTNTYSRLYHLDNGERRYIINYTTTSTNITDTHSLILDARKTADIQFSIEAECLKKTNGAWKSLGLEELTTTKTSYTYEIDTDCVVQGGSVNGTVEVRLKASGFGTTVEGEIYETRLIYGKNTSYPRDITVDVQGVQKCVYTGELASSWNCTTNTGIRTKDTPVNVSFTSTTGGMIEVDISHTINYTGVLNLTFTNQTDFKIIESNGSTIYHLQPGDSLNYYKNLSELKPRENITIEFLNKTMAEPTKTGYYQYFQFYNDMNRTYNEVLRPMIPDTQVEVYMKSSHGARTPGYIQIYHTNGGNWETIQRVATTGNNEEAKVYLASDNTYMFCGESDGYERNCIIEPIVQLQTIPIEIPLGEIDPIDEYNIYGRCLNTNTLKIENLTQVCTLYVMNLDAGKNITIITNYYNETSQASIVMSRSVIASSYTMTLLINDTYNEALSTVYLNGVVASQIHFEYEPPLGVGDKEVDILIPTTLKNKFYKAFLLIALITAVIIGGLLNKLKSGWGMPGFFMGLGLWAIEFPILLTGLIPFLLIWIWFSKMKNISISN